MSRKEGESRNKLGKEGEKGGKKKEKIHNTYSGCKEGRGEEKV